MFSSHSTFILGCYYDHSSARPSCKEVDDILCLLYLIVTRTREGRGIGPFMKPDTMKIFGASSRNRSWAGVQQHRTGKASLALLVMSLLGSEYHTSPCSAFVLSVVTAPSSVPGSLAAAAGNLSPSLTAVRRRDSNRVSSSSCGPAAAATAAAGVPPLGRPCSALAASNNNGADDDASVSVGTGPSGSSADVFEALMAGDMAFVTEYVQSGGDCNIQDSIGMETQLWVIGYNDNCIRILPQQCLQQLPWFPELQTENG